MRTFNWNKLPVSKIWGKKNIWSLVVKKNETGPNKAKIDFNDMESLFCQQTASVASGAINGSVGGPNSGSQTTKDNAEDQKKKQKDEVSNVLKHSGKFGYNLATFSAKYLIRHYSDF